MSDIPAPQISTRDARRVATAGAVGSVIEWYDYGLYGTASAVVFSKLFFPSLDPAAAQIASLATFAVGFAARPIGGLIFSNIGDRLGRKSTLIATILVMGIATTLAGLLPTYDAIGLAAPIILIVLRIVQGLGAGAEFSGAITYVAEGVEVRRRSFRTAFTGSASVAGGFLANLIMTLLSTSIPEGPFLSWGWRIAFLLSAVLTIVAVLVRSRITESVMFTVLKEQEAAGATRKIRVPFFDMLRNDTRSFFAAWFTPTSFIVIAYIIPVFGLSYMTQNLQLSSTASLWLVITVQLVGIIVTPLFGLLADRFGSKQVMLGGAIFAVVMAVPYFLALGSRNFPLMFIASIVVYGVIWGAGAGGQGDFLPSLFKTRYRFTGVASGRELNAAIFAGPASLIAAALVSSTGGAIWTVGIYMMILAAISVVGILLGRPRVMQVDEDATPDAVNSAGGR